MNPYFVAVITILIVQFVIKITADHLNVKNVSTTLPEEFSGYYDPEKYKISQEYLRDTTRFKMVESVFSLILIVSLIVLGGFNGIDTFSRSLGLSEILTGLVFIGVIFFGMQMISIPFSAYKTFVIEEKYGFNRTTVRTFIMDLVKGFVLGFIIGGVVLAGILWFFHKTGNAAWIYCWLAVTLFQIFLIFISPIVILPLFNKFVPLEDGELKDEIQSYAANQNFGLSGIYKMDGSKRSSKTNAFFTGFGKFRRIALFDTLIEKHTVPELVAVLAHEVGHYKKKHIIKSMVMSFFISGIMFFLLSVLIKNKLLFDAFKMDNISVYAGIIFFSFLYTPISMFFSVMLNIFSRHNEHEADKFAAETYGNCNAMIDALKKLSVANLSNLTPHPFKVFLDYSHPPVLDRVRALRELHSRKSSLDCARDL